MRLTTTLIMLAAVALLVGAIVSIEKFFPSTREAEAKQKNPGAFDADRVTDIEIAVKESRLKLGKRNGHWRVESPFDDLADPGQIGRLIEGLQNMEWVEKLNKEEFKRGEWAETGLDAPAVKISIRGEGDRLVDFEFGAETAIEDTLFLAIPSERETGYYVVKTGLGKIFLAPSMEWRDTQLLRFPPDQVTRILITQSSGPVEMARESANSGWKLTKPLQTRGSNERIGELLFALLNIKLTGVAAAPGAAPLPSTGEEIDIEMDMSGQPDPLKARLFVPADTQLGATAEVNNRQQTFTVSPDSLQVFRIQPNDVRDNHLASLDEGKVEEMIIDSAAHPEVSLTRKDQSWYLHRHGKLEPANGDRVEKMFEALHAQRIREFASDSASDLAAFGLEAPFLSLKWKATGQPDQELLFGLVEREAIYAKYRDEPFVYRVDATVLSAIPPDPVKWKGLNPVRFSQFALRQISLSVGTAPPLLLNYDSVNASWTASRAGEDITGNIDRVKADRLAGGLAKLRVQDWLQDRSQGLQALRSPYIHVQITLGDPGNPAAPPDLVKLNFSPTQEGLDTPIYYGQIEGNPDVFFVGRDYLRELLASVFKDISR